MDVYTEINRVKSLIVVGASISAPLRITLVMRAVNVIKRVIMRYKGLVPQ